MDHGWTLDVILIGLRTISDPTVVCRSRADSIETVPAGLVLCVAPIYEHNANNLAHSRSLSHTHNTQTETTTNTPTDRRGHLHIAAHTIHACTACMHLYACTRMGTCTCTPAPP
eukprot:scaffold18394_cov130-Isochrysis_galbana.AAC.2